MKWNEDAPSDYQVKHDRVEVPWFSVKLKLPTALYQVKRIVFICKSESWIIETDKFKLSIGKDEAEFWQLLDSALLDSDAVFCKIKEAMYTLQTAEDNTPWALSLFEKCEIYQTAMEYGTFFEVGGKLVNEKDLPTQPTLTRRSRQDSAPY